jgi:hypothetical protein
MKIALSLLLALLAFINGLTLYDNKQGVQDGLNYELWKDKGETSMDLLGGGKFKCHWNNINNALFRIGKKWDCTKEWWEYGEITVDYDVDYRPNGNSYLCVYGWTKEPLIEYYIVESWGTWRPPGGTPKQSMYVDDGKYDVYVTDRFNQPSIIGNTNFKQYWSVRTAKKTKGTIHLNHHFYNWQQMGLKLGKMYEASLTVEGYQSSGDATVYKNVITQNKVSSGDTGNSGNTGNTGNTGGNQSGGSAASLTNPKKILSNNARGKIDGLDYELWKDYGTTQMRLYGGGKFDCSWSNINNALFRIGKKWDCTKTWEQLGSIVVNYGVDYQPNGNSYLCVYGWTRSPLIEYYIVDSWGTWRPPGGTSRGTISVDGGTYDVYVTDRINQPSIDGNTTFKQFWSVRTQKKTSGKISVDKHFSAWTRMGLKLGKMYEASLNVEGYQSSGKAAIYQNEVIGG